MGMPASPTIWTVDMLDALPDDGQRHEIIDGELCLTPAPMPPHQLVLMRLSLLLGKYLEQSRVAMLIATPADVRRGKYRSFQPDGFVVRLADGKLPAYPYAPSDLLLAIEVNSPSTVRLDYRVKKRVYLEDGVGEYWVVNTEARNVTRWRGCAEPGDVLMDEISWQAPDLDHPLVVDLPVMFADALRPTEP